MSRELKKNVREKFAVLEETQYASCYTKFLPFSDDLPPPPEPSEYVPCVPGNSFPPPPEELPPPPSPVSSSYSELRRATYQTDYPSGSYPADIYGPSSQSSSTYESIYEPINPRPPSQLSCNYSVYSGYGSATSTQPQGKVSPVKEVSLEMSSVAPVTAFRAASALFVDTLECCAEQS